MTLDEVVREYLLENELTEHKYLKVLQFGIVATRELYYDVTGVPVIKILTVNEDDTVDLPSDYLNYIKIGFTDNYGHFQSLGENRNISLNRTIDDCGQPGSRYDEADPSDASIYGANSASDYVAAHYRNGENVGRFYGAGGGNNVNGGFKIDKDYAQIQLEGYRGGDTIILEYLADPAKTSSTMEVIPFAVETVKAYIDWKMALTHPRNKVDAPYKAQIYKTSNKKLRARLKSKSVQDILQSFRKGNKQSPKF